MNFNRNRSLLVSIGLSFLLATPAFSAAKGALKTNILARLEAKPGQEKALNDFLVGGLALAQSETQTAQWFAYKIDEKTYGVFDTFAGEQGRSAHLSGEIAKGLGANRAALLGPDPVLEKGDIISTNFNGDVKKANVKVGFLAILEAKPGKEKELEKMLKNAPSIIKKETKTIHWYSFKLSPSKFGVLDTFADDAGRSAHASGDLAKAIGANAKTLLAKPPVMEKIDLIAVKP